MVRVSRNVSIIVQQDATIYSLYLQTALHVLGGISTRRQKLISLDWNVYTCLTQLYGGRDTYIIYYM